MIKIYKITVCIVITLLIILGAFSIDQSLHKKKVVYGDVSNFNPLPASPTETGVLCGTSQVQLLATSSAGRPFASISNLAGFAIYLGFGNSATLYKGIMVPASTTITLNQGALYLGQIMCISTASASTSISAVN